MCTMNAINVIVDHRIHVTMWLLRHKDAMNHRLAQIRPPLVKFSGLLCIADVNRLVLDDRVDINTCLNVEHWEPLLKLLVDRTVRMSEVASNND